MFKIILEGPDNAGKTSLAKHLQQGAPSIAYMHPGGAPANFAEEKRCVEEQTNFLMSNDFCILDRTTTISQRVYNPDAIGDRHRAEQLRQMLLTGALIVYARPPIDRMMAVDKFLWKDYDTEDHKQKIIKNQHTFIERYDAIMRRTPHVAYDFTDPTSEMFRNEMVKAFRGDRDAIHFVRNLPQFRGV